MARFDRPGRRNRRLGLLIIASLLVLSMTPMYREAISFPHIVRVPAESEVDIGFPFPRLLRVRSADGDLFLGGTSIEPGQWLPVDRGGLSVGASTAGVTTLDVRLFGFIPFRQVQVITVPQYHVVPGGQSVGVLARSEGLLVIEPAPVAAAESGRQVWPARDAGIRVGDILLSADGIRLADADDLAELVQAAGRRGRDVSLEVRRGDQRFSVQIRPQLDGDSGQYLLGLWVRDGAAGVGTLTFWDPETLVYAALGHEILDPSSSRLLEIESGMIVEATVWGLNRAQAGQPGEKIGVFSDRSPILGDIQVNSRHGIMGLLDRPLETGARVEVLPIALAEEVEVGPAEILTVLRGSNVGRFAVNIERVAGQQRPGSKSLVIRVVDGTLLEAAGGIVQGMSGSPIIQNGRVVGAVTHVFLSDPSRGYGIFAEWMAVEGEAVTTGVGSGLSGVAAFSSPRVP